MKFETFFPNQNRHVRFLLGLYISRKRRESGASLTELANKADLTPQSIKRIEAGRMNVTPRIFGNLQVALGFEAEDLNEIRRIAGVAYINDLSKVLVPNFPV
ncbi:MAG: helix-turn-helix transcriptional regulator [Bdellovibrionales bacterium]|nr:helix-turn-helix transcriptional regulator [Bdellovibrionales bacterium]